MEFEVTKLVTSTDSDSLRMIDAVFSSQTLDLFTLHIKKGGQNISSFSLIPINSVEDLSPWVQGILPSNIFNELENYIFITELQSNRTAREPMATSHLFIKSLQWVSLNLPHTHFFAIAEPPYIRIYEKFGGKLAPIPSFIPPQRTMHYHLLYGSVNASLSICKMYWNKGIGINGI